MKEEENEQNTHSLIKKIGVKTTIYCVEWADFNGDDGGRTGQDEPSLLMRWNGNGREIVR